MESFVDLTHTLPDLSREARCGRPETVYCPGKTPAQVAEISRTLFDRHGYCLCTRAEAEQVAAVQAGWTGEPSLIDYQPTARLLRLGQAPPRSADLRVGVISAGTADQAVAEEASGSLEFFGWQVERIRDVGVAGLHRLLARLELVRSCHVLIVVAGMEGALPSVVGGLVARPVIAVPTSVGYGAHFGGLAPLLTMLNSCASGITVCNIDNGFGAACAADAVLRLAAGIT
jgi:NCAIR mutase (PurE)-related protein